MKVALFMSLCLIALTGVGVKSYYYFNRKPLSFSYPEIECDSNGVPLKYPYDVHFPHTPENYPYTLTVPPLEGRLTLSEDGRKATLFAPFTTKEKGWNDVNKHWDGKDNNLCWAASASNCIAWYLRVCEEQKIEDVSMYDKNVGDVFNKFRGNWDARMGSDPVEGLNWYFTGKFARGEPPENLLVKNSGGFLKRMKNVGDVWTLINLKNIYGVYGNNEIQFPFAQDYTGINGPPLTDYEALSKNLLGQLHYGPLIFSLLGSTVGTGGGHAVTCWGADFDAKTGLITNFYIADNDDSFTELFSGKVKRGGGISAEFIFYPKRGTVPLARIQSSTVVYAPGVAKVKEGSSSGSDIGGGGSDGESTGGDSQSDSCPGKIEYKHDEFWHWTYCKETNKEGEKDIHTYSNWDTKESNQNYLYQKCVCGRENAFQLDISAINHVYDGTPKSLMKYINLPYAVKVFYKLDDAEFSENIPTATEPNKYNVYYKIVNEGGKTVLESHVIAEIKDPNKPAPHPELPDEGDTPDPPKEKEDPVNPNPEDQNNAQESDNDNGEKANNSTMIIIISCVSALVVVLIIVAAIVIIRKRKNSKLKIDSSYDDDDETGL